MTTKSGPSDDVGHNGDVATERIEVFVLPKDSVKGYPGASSDDVGLSCESWVGKMPRELCRGRRHGTATEHLN